MGEAEGAFGRRAAPLAVIRPASPQREGRWTIGSIAKTFTGVALMRAVQEGKLSLDEDIDVYLP